MFLLSLKNSDLSGALEDISTLNSNKMGWNGEGKKAVSYYDSIIVDYLREKSSGLVSFGIDGHGYYGLWFNHGFGANRVDGSLILLSYTTLFRPIYYYITNSIIIYEYLL